MTTLPERPEGGIDWERFPLIPYSDTSIPLREHIREAAKRAAVYTLERCAKWHDEQARCLQVILDADNYNDPRGEAVILSLIQEHVLGAAAFRNMES